MEGTDYVAKPLNADRCRGIVRPENGLVTFQCNMPRGYGPRGKFCKQHAPREVPPDATDETKP